AVAQVDDTRARTLLAEGRVSEGERVARYAVRGLEKGDEQAVLAEALTTHGVALARLGDYPPAKRLLERAIEVAETTGDPEGAGRGKLSIIEELYGQTPALQLVSIYESAAELLKQSQDPSTSKRLITCAQRVISIINIRHNDLIKTRSRIRKRRRHIFSESRKPNKPDASMTRSQLKRLKP